MPPLQHHCLTPPKLAAFYRHVNGDYDKLFLDMPDSALSVIYRGIGCFHTLQPTLDPRAPPTIPALTTTGFVRWQTVQLLLGPEEHVPYLQEAVKRYDIKNLEDGSSFPKVLPKEAFPLHPDPEVARWHDEELERFRLQAQREAHPISPLLINSHPVPHPSSDHRSRPHSPGLDGPRSDSDAESPGTMRGKGWAMWDIPFRHIVRPTSRDRRPPSPSRKELGPDVQDWGRRNSYPPHQYYEDSDDDQTRRGHAPAPSVASNQHPRIPLPPHMRAGPHVNIRPPSLGPRTATTPLTRSRTQSRDTSPRGSPHRPSMYDNHNRRKSSPHIYPSQMLPPPTINPYPPAPHSPAWPHPPSASNRASRPTTPSGLSRGQPSSSGHVPSSSYHPSSQQPQPYFAAPKDAHGIPSSPTTLSASQLSSPTSGSQPAHQHHHHHHQQPQSPGMRPMTWQPQATLDAPPPPAANFARGHLRNMSDQSLVGKSPLRGRVRREDFSDGDSESGDEMLRGNGGRRAARGR